MENINKSKETSNIIQFMTPREVADTLKVHVVTVRREVDRGNLKAFIVGRHIRINSKDFDEYVDLNSTGEKIAA